MASLRDTLNDFREFKNRPNKTGLLSTALAGLKKKVVVLTPGSTSPELRWALTFMCLQLIWSAAAPGSVITGAFFTVLTMFAENPAQLLRAIGNDPDIEAQIVEVVQDRDGKLKLSSRGMDLSKQQEKYERIAEYGPDDGGDNNPFMRGDIPGMLIRTTENLQNALATITLQIWILLTKAVTAPDTARDSEQRRWIKYLQQKKAHAEYQLKVKWLDYARARMAEDISVRRLMVEILVEVNKISGVKNRILEMIMDVGEYIAETGMAGFHLTIKYGLETRFSALALNEFQSDLNTLIQLMKLYKEQGERAPYMVIIEDSTQTKFSPGNYPLIWSFAMGVGTTLDRAMNGLNYNRPYLEPGFFRLGQDVVGRAEGNVDTRMADELGLTQGQIDDLKNLTQGAQVDRPTAAATNRTSRFVPAAIDPTDDDDNQIGVEVPTTPAVRHPAIVRPKVLVPSGTKIQHTVDEERNFRDTLRSIASNFNPISSKNDKGAGATQAKPTSSSSESGSTDLDFIRAA
ncbi:nucleocapsid protein [Jingmen Miniopterus schreibersii paramyxovirus 2]|nr:nucleocapsid protein [Jingmen Miniopterus schreibersii paramyxovirus 2]